jgi:membrane fusion protein (multidrug efflux system)
MQQHLKALLSTIFRTSMVGYCLLVLQGCSSKEEKEKTVTPLVSTITVDTTSVTTELEFSGMLEGISNIEIRSQAEGYLEKIFVDEGAYVKKGQPLFLINDTPYSERLNQSSASLQTALANREKARIETTRIQKLVEGKVVSDVQLKNAQAELSAANSAVRQAEATKKSAVISKGFTLIKAPVNGYVGKLPYRVGSLVGHNEPEPLSVVSDINTMYAYFSMSEEAFLQFKQQYPGKTIEEKIKRIPSVRLMLPDNSVYDEQGKVDIVQGQFDKSTGSIMFRASFPNNGGLLRSGNTGKIIMSQYNKNVIQIPQSATYELQNKVMAYVVGKDNKLNSVSLKIRQKTALNYIISEGLKPGDILVSKGLERLHEGIQVKVSK